MKSIDSVISKVDAFTQPLEINFESEKRHGICFPFLATLLLVTIVAGTTIGSLVDLFSYKKVTVTRRQEIENKEGFVNGTIPMVAFKINLFYDLDYYQYTLIYFVNNPEKKQIQMDLQRCTPNHWKSISKQEYEKYNVSSYYCPANFNNFQLKSQYMWGGLNFIALYVYPSRQSDYHFQKNQKYYWSVEMLLFSQKFQENQKSLFKNELVYFKKSQYFNFINFVPFVYDISEVRTDYSFFPFASPKIQKLITLGSFQPNYYWIDQKFLYDNYLYLFKCVIKINPKFSSYERNVGKITDIFSQSGGLFTSLSGILGLAVLLYYNYKLRLKLAENTFKKSKNAIKPSDYGFMKSLGYGVRGIVKPDENGKFAKECQRIESNLNEVDSLVHIEVMLKRLEMLEGAFEYSSDKDEFACLSLLERSSMEKFRYKRVRIEYYDYIVRDRNGMTIRDARELYNGLGMNLEAFFNRRLNHRMQLLNQRKSIAKSSQTFESQAQIETANQIITNVQIQSSPQILVQSFVLFIESKSGLNILQKVIDQFADIKSEAEAIDITPEYAKIEVSLAKAFYKVNQDSRVMLQQKIPIIILHRLLKVIREIWRKSQEKQLKKKQESGDKDENKDEEEELKDWDDQFKEEL